MEDLNYLILVRHGQSEWNAKNLFTGWKDPDLTDQGRNEASIKMMQERNGEKSKFIFGEDHTMYLHPGVRA